jgi:hypothetical protein
MFGSDEGFRPKNVQGIMANYCAVCGGHLDLHGTRRVPGSGSVRTCPGPAKAGRSPSKAVEASGSQTPAKRLIEPLPTPFGTDTSFEQLSPRRQKKLVVGSPVDSMNGGMVVRDEPPVLVSPSPLAPRGSLSGSGVQSSYDERQDWVPSKAVVKGLQDSKLDGQSLVPTRSDSPKRRGPRTVIK